MTEELAKLFAQCESIGASDMHLASGEMPRFRIQGELMPHPGYGKLDGEKVDAIAMELGLETLPLGSPDGTERIRLTLLREGSIDGAITSPDNFRYRFNIYRDGRGTAVAMRRLDSKFHSFEELHLPRQLEEFCGYQDGLVIVTGPTGSGKSTTLATMIDRINHTRQGHIITIEDPIEFVHQSHRSLVNQRQVGRDARDFNTALVEALRQDPDVILVGEVRDLATIRTAVTAAETGHLVFATLHAGDCAGAIERLVSVYPADEQDSVRRQLSIVLRGIFAQHLLPAVAGGRVPAYELLVNTTAVANLIATGRSAQLYSTLETGSRFGMTLLDQSLAQLLAEGRIGESVARSLSRSPDTLRARILSMRGGMS